MNSVYVKDVLNTNYYQDFIKEHPATAKLNIRAYAASEAIPISNLKVIVFKEIDNNKVIFYEGVTNNSGLIEGIILPTTALSEDNLDAPVFTTYTIESSYNNIIKTYKVNMYDDICVIQNITIVPNANLEMSDL